MKLAQVTIGRCGAALVSVELAEVAYSRFVWVLGNSGVWVCRAFRCLGLSVLGRFGASVFQVPKKLGPELKNTFVESRARTGDPRTSTVEGRERREKGEGRG